MAWNDKKTEPAKEIATDPVSTAIDDPVELDAAHRRAQLDDLLGEGLIVTPRLMKLLQREEGVKSITYGKPGVRLFVEGAKDQVLSEDSMHVEAHYDMTMRRRGEDAKTKRSVK